jgi:predicted RNA binding protein YcfA (HicA-like mRNA interferase family)
MSRGLHNWNFYDVEKFLKKNGFRLNHVRGSHYFFTAAARGITRQVLVAFHGSKSIKPKTMKSIIDQSGLSVEVWEN